MIRKNKFVCEIGINKSYWNKIILIWIIVENINTNKDEEKILYCSTLQKVYPLRSINRLRHTNSVI